MILVFLWHISSAIIPILTIPVSVVLAFIPLYFMGLTSNIMSLAGIAISIGVLVDGAIVEVENAYKKLEQWNDGRRRRDFHDVRLEALKEVGPSVFFSLLVIAVAFLPVFTLVDQEGRLFKPLAYTKNLAMAIAAILAITLDPAMRMMFTRMDYSRSGPAGWPGSRQPARVGRYYPEEKHPISDGLFRIYEPPAGSCSGTQGDDPRCCRRPRPDDDPRLPPARLGVHAAALRGHDPLHADDAAGHLGDRGAEAPPGAGQAS